jgi:hypothetical protein
MRTSGQQLLLAATLCVIMCSCVALERPDAQAPHGEGGHGIAISGVGLTERLATDYTI